MVNVEWTSKDSFVVWFPPKTEMHWSSMMVSVLHSLVIGLLVYITVKLLLQDKYMIYLIYSFLWLIIMMIVWVCLKTQKYQSSQDSAIYLHTLFCWFKAEWRPIERVSPSHIEWTAAYSGYQHVKLSSRLLTSSALYPMSWWHPWTKLLWCWSLLDLLQ